MLLLVEKCFKTIVSNHSKNSNMRTISTSTYSTKTSLASYEYKHAKGVRVHHPFLTTQNHRSILAIVSHNRRTSITFAQPEGSIGGYCPVWEASPSE